MTEKFDTEQERQGRTIDYNKRITDDYECKKDCRNCPFPGAKCYPSKYETHRRSHDYR